MLDVYKVSDSMEFSSVSFEDILDGQLGNREAKAAKKWLAEGCPVRSPLTGPQIVTRIEDYDTAIGPPVAEIQIPEDINPLEREERPSESPSGEKKKISKTAGQTNSDSVPQRQRDSEEEMLGKGHSIEPRLGDLEKEVEDDTKPPYFGPDVLPTNLRLKQLSKPPLDLPGGWVHRKMIKIKGEPSADSEPWVSPEGLACTDWEMAATVMALNSVTKVSGALSDEVKSESRKSQKIRDLVRWIRGVAASKVVVNTKDVGVKGSLHSQSSGLARLVVLQRIRSSLFPRDRYSVRKKHTRRTTLRSKS